MPMTLELTDELVEQLTREAVCRNLSLSEYALRLLASGNPREFKFPRWRERVGLLGIQRRFGFSCRHFG